MRRKLFRLLTKASIPIKATDDENIPINNKTVTNNFCARSLDMSLLSANIHIDIIVAVIPASWRRKI